MTPGVRPIVVLSNERQWQAVAAQVDPASLNVYCDNPRFVDTLCKRGVSPQILDEFLLDTDSWKEINSAGCAGAGKALALAKNEAIFDRTDLAAVLFLKLGYILVQAIKNLRFARRVLEENPGAPVIVLDIQNPPEYPAFSGNVFLNYFLAEFAFGEGRRIQKIPVLYWRDVLVRGLSWAHRLKAGSLKALRSCLTAVYGRLPKKSSYDFIAKGSLRHLGPLASGAAAQGMTGALYDHTFQMKGYRFARQQGLDYLVGAIPESKSRHGEQVAELKSAMDRWLDRVEREGLWQDRKHDLMPFMRENVFCRIDSYLSTIITTAVRAARVQGRYRAKAWIFDEDTTPESAPWVEQLSRMDTRALCISHAVMPVDFEVSHEAQSFRLSETWVHSDFEKAMYAARGWDPAGIRVTGLPRFDRYAETAPNPGRSGVPKFLYCGASMKQFWPERGGYLGMHITNYGDCQRRSIRAIVDALREKNAELWLKPHNFEGRQWRDFIETLDAGKLKIRLWDYRTDFKRLLENCDALFLSHYSTALIEAAYLEKPTVLLQLFHPGKLAPYDEYGFCRMVHDESALKTAVSELTENPEQAGGRRMKPGADAVFGRRDGRALRRCLEALKEVVKEDPEKKRGLRV